MTSKMRQAARAAYIESLKKPVAKVVPIRAVPSAEQAKAMGWEKSVPRCGNCRQYTGPKTILHKQTNNLPVVIVRPICQRGRFHTSETAVCDFWVGHDGATLQ